MRDDPDRIDRLRMQAVQDASERSVHEANQTMFNNWKEEAEARVELFSQALAVVSRAIPQHDFTMSIVEHIDALESAFESAVSEQRHLRAIIFGRPLDYDLDAWLAFAQEKENMREVVRAVIDSHRAQGELLDMMAAQMFNLDPCAPDIPPIDWHVMRSQVFKHFTKDEGDTVDKVLGLVQTMLGEIESGGVS